MEELSLKNKGINGTVLKIIALISMTLDHIGILLFHNNPIMHSIGRLAFPLFAFFIAEGCYYTKNRKNYLLKIALFGVLTQIIFIIFYKPFYFNVLLTFSFSILIIFFYDSIKKENSSILYLFFLFILSFAFFLFEILPQVFYRTKYYFYFDYGFIGVIFPLCLYIVKDKNYKIVCFIIGLVLLSVKHMGVQWFCLFDGILIFLYNGQRGKYSLKYIFYLYYPLHFLVIFFIKLLI